MKLQGVFIAIFVIAMMASGYGFLAYEYDSNYGALNDTDLHETLQVFEVQNETLQNVEQMRQQVESNSTSILDILGFATKGAYSMLTLSMDSMKSIGKMLNIMAEKLQIPDKFVWGITGIIMVSILLAIAAAIFRVGV